MYTGIYKRAENEVTWMWFIFPKIRGLGRSGRALRFAISSRDEAEAYLNILSSAPDYESVAGSWPPSMTLLAHVATDNEVFNDCLRKYFAGKADPHMLARL